MDKYSMEIADMMAEADAFGPAYMLARRFTKRVLEIPVRASFMANDIETLDLSVRSGNALKRNGIRTIGNLVAYAESGKKLKDIRNMGVKSGVEVLEKLLDEAYRDLGESERAEFIRRAAEKSRAYIKSAE